MDCEARLGWVVGEDGSAAEYCLLRVEGAVRRAQQPLQQLHVGRVHRVRHLPPARAATRATPLAATRGAHVRQGQPRGERCRQLVHVNSGQRRVVGRGLAARGAAVAAAAAAAAAADGTGAPHVGAIYAAGVRLTHTRARLAPARA